MPAYTRAARTKKSRKKAARKKEAWVRGVKRPEQCKNLLDVRAAIRAVGFARHQVVQALSGAVATGERIAAVMERLLDRPAYAEHVRGHTVAEQTPVPQAMETILRFVGERGGAGGWLREQGWSADQVARLRERLRA